ncbi:hypothetical protein FAUST_9888 [Fusarium austroamericanum]|uniref:PD-(D/E)XK nuclease-like domain-containing protein n=1 Tax=Fusarium austroamericanum TaxID=282268 RepID=A0AAN5Z2P3_FUSAU|nr:hypothetical protein FAUST_9888 [Fusarium austroamericanum]
MKKSHLPKHMHKTYDTIFSTAHGNNFIPNAVQEELKDSDEDILPHNELAALREIQDAAISRQTQGASESAWNVDVHGPLLKLAFKPFRSLKREIITHANISKPFVPEVRTDSYYNVTKSKMIDWGVTISPPEATAEHISKIVDSLPHSERSINQTIYGPVKNNPIAVSIKVKVASASLEEARGQLGLWIAAWCRRMSLLRKSEENIITVPLVMVMEHEWKLMFAIGRGDAIEVVEDIRMGDTRDLPGLYRIIAILRELAIWVETDYLTCLDRRLDPYHVKELFRAFRHGQLDRESPKNYIQVICQPRIFNTVSQASAPLPPPPPGQIPISQRVGPSILEMIEDKNNAAALRFGAFQGYSNIERTICHNPEDLLTSHGLVTAALTLPKSEADKKAAATKVKQQKLLCSLCGEQTGSASSRVAGMHPKRALTPQW